MKAYYNEIDPYCAQWLRNLIAAGHIAPGDVDERSIADVRPDDLRGYERVHLFAGIAGWDHALNLAGWRGPVWTASCPCPPFSAAGKRQKCPQCKSRHLVWCPRRTGFAICAVCSHTWEADARHLWPEVWRLAAECGPQRIFGEQVASEDGIDWFAGVRASLEILRYAVGVADLPACSVGAPHRRQRLYWVADADGRHASAEGIQRSGQHGQQSQDGGAGGLEHAASDGRQQWRPEPSGRCIGGGCGAGRLGDADVEGLTRQPLGLLGAGHQGHWSSATWLECLDGKARRVEPGIQPLAHGVPARVGKLRAYGNAIVPQVAARFIEAVMS